MREKMKLSLYTEISEYSIDKPLKIIREYSKIAK